MTAAEQDLRGEIALAIMRTRPRIGGSGCVSRCSIPLLTEGKHVKRCGASWPKSAQGTPNLGENMAKLVSYLTM